MANLTLKAFGKMKLDVIASRKMKPRLYLTDDGLIPSELCIMMDEILVKCT